MAWYDPFVEAAETVGDAIVDVGEVIVEGAEDAWDAMTGAAEDAAKAAEDAAKAAAEAAEKLADAIESATNDVYDAGAGAADAIADGIVAAGEWGIGAFETVGSGIAEGLRSIPEEVSDSVSTWVHDNLGEYAKAIGTGFASAVAAGILGSPSEEKTQGPFGTESQALSVVAGDGAVFPEGGIFDGLRDALEGAIGGSKPDLSDATPTVDEALLATSVSSAALADTDTNDQNSDVGALLGTAGGLGGLSLGDTAQPLGAFGDASNAGIIVVGGHEGPGAAFTDANPLLEGLSRIAGASFGSKPFVSVVGDISNEHRELARETLDGVELPNTSIPELVNEEPFNERPFELPGLDGLFGGRDLLGWIGGQGGYGGPNGPGGIPGGLGGHGGPGGFEGLPGWLGGRGGLGDLGGFPGGFGGPGDGAPIGDDGFGGGLGGFGGLPGWLTGDGNGGLDGLFGGGPRDWGSAGGFGGIDPGGAGGIDGLGIGLPSDLGGSRMPDIKLKGEDAMWHEEGNKVVADKGESLQVERGTNSFTVSEGKSFEKHEGDQFVSNKEPNTHYYVSDGKVEKVGGSNSGGTTDDKPHPGDPKGMPADDGSGGGPNWSAAAMPADDGSGGGPNWSPHAMPADDGSGGGPNWSAYAMPADDSVGGGGPNWSLHDSSAVAMFTDSQPTSADHQFASAFTAIEPHFSHDGVSALGSHMWF